MMARLYKHMHRRFQFPNGVFDLKLNQLRIRDTRWDNKFTLKRIYIDALLLDVKIRN